MRTVAIVVVSAVISSLLTIAVVGPDVQPAGAAIQPRPADDDSEVVELLQRIIRLLERPTIETPEREAVDSDPVDAIDDDRFSRLLAAIAAEGTTTRAAGAANGSTGYIGLREVRRRHPTPNHAAIQHLAAQFKDDEDGLLEHLLLLPATELLERFGEPDDIDVTGAGFYFTWNFPDDDMEWLAVNVRDGVVSHASITERDDD